MCGICGLLVPAGRPDTALVDAMRAALVHRGPDEGSTHVLGRCALGNQRLQVLDLETGSQPVTNEAGDVIAVFNGELYNFRQLRAGLADRGHTVRGTGDTPVIPHLYEEHGPRFVERLSGMFAIALWDARRERLLLARDRVGKKPLLWTRLDDGTLLFASELKALLRITAVDRELDLAALDSYLALQYVIGEKTPLKRVRKLAPGHLLLAQGGRERVERWWRAEPRTERTSSDESEWLDRVGQTVRSAVERRLAADVPLGALLSGGIDSSVVVALMAEASSTPVRTFTVGFGDPRYDERDQARALASRYGTQHEEVVLEPDAATTLPRFIDTFDEPLGDEAALGLFLVCEQARGAVTVALTGDGGDEAFAGYERYAALRLAERLRLPRLVGRALRRVPAARRERRSALFRAARFLDLAAAAPADRYGTVMEIFPAAMREELWTRDALAAIEGSRSATELLGPSPAAGTTGLQLLDLQTYLPGDLLLKADLASMAHSLELRSPLLDHQVVELGLTLPDSLKIRGLRGKEALRRTFSAELPPQITRARKKGFALPLGDWFRGPLRELLGDTLLDSRARGRGLLRPKAVEKLVAEHASGEADHGHQLWCLLVLELWHRRHLETAGSVAATAV